MAPNQVVTGRRFHLLRTGLGLLANPLVLILLAASVVSSVVGEALDAGIIVTIVLVSVGLDFFQMFHSEQACEGAKVCGWSGCSLVHVM